MGNSNISKFFIILLPLLEIAGFIIVGSWIGVIGTLLLIVATTILGLFILRHQGFANLKNMQAKLAAGEHPAAEMLNHTLVLFAGLLLLIPGFITDLIGLLLLIPIIRHIIFRWIILSGKITVSRAPRAKAPANHTIEGEFHRED